MLSFLIKRLSALIPTVLLVITLSFFLLHMIPGDPAAVLLGPNATPEQIAALKHSLGLDRPVFVQYVKYMARVLRGDFGNSIYFQQPVLKVVLSHAEASFLLATLGLMVVILLGVSSGITSAVLSKTAYDKVFLSFALLGASIPSFWLGLLLILLFGVRLRVFPTSGFVSVLSTGNLSNLRYLVLPALTLGAVNSAVVARVTRSAMLEVLHQQYIDVARAKGLNSANVILKHALRNAAIPIVTVLGFVFAGMMATAVVTENVFAIPGIGRLVVQSVLRRDYPMIQGIMVLVAFLYLVVNLATDIVYTILDPRIRLT
jgi:peptide/nickel transport system permease protein